MLKNSIYEKLLYLFFYKFPFTLKSQTLKQILKESDFQLDPLFWPFKTLIKYRTGPLEPLLYHRR